MELKNIEFNYDLNMSIGKVHQSIVNNQLYTLVNPCNLLRYSPVEDKWIEVSVTEILIALNNYQYVEYKPNESHNYVECSFEEAYLITDKGIGCAYVKLIDQYLSLEALKESVDLMQFVEFVDASTSIKFYKERFARSYSHMDSLEEEILVIPLNDPYDDIYF